MNDEFRPCPSFPGHSASEDGRILRHAFTSIAKTGRVQIKNERILTIVDRQSIVIDRQYVRVAWLVEDAWVAPVGNWKERRQERKLSGKVRSSYRDGRIVTARDYFARMQRA